MSNKSSVGETKVTYWDRYGKPPVYHIYTFKRLWLWVFIKLLYIRFFYDEMIFGELDEE